MMMVPAAQAVHTTELPAEYVPTRHCTGDTAGLEHWLPAAQTVHELAPGLAA